MRALPEILDARPRARALIVGGNGTSYGKASDEPGGYRAAMEREVGDRIDWDRVHSSGRVPYASYRSILQISRCHVYLTVPFVVSWSLLEAMSMGATVVASDVAPVREVMEHGKTGLFVDFFDPPALARQVADVLANPGPLRPRSECPRPRYRNLRLPHPRAADACREDQRSRRALHATVVAAVDALTDTQRLKRQKIAGFCP
jgi:glycosyltransferase involved in cell wall biosynthesis